MHELAINAWIRPFPSGEMEKKKKNADPPRDPSTDKSTLESVGLEFLRKRVENGGERVGRARSMGWRDGNVWNGGGWILEEFVGVKILEIVLGKVEWDGTIWRWWTLSASFELISRGNFEILVEEQGSVECELGRSSISFYQD